MNTSTSAVGEAVPAEQELFPAPDTGWALVGLAGGVLALIGSIDIALAWYPMNFGNPAWEFGTISATLDAMPVVMLGFGLLLGTGVARGQRGLIRFTVGAFVLLGLVILTLAALYATTIPIALRSVSDPLVRIGVLKAIGKAGIQMVLYPAVFFWLAVKGWRHSTGRWSWQVGGP